MIHHKILDPSSKAAVSPGLCALGIVTKAPQAGKVKTRLSPPLTPGEAAEMNRCFLRDIGSAISLACQQSPARGVGVYTPRGAEDEYKDILPGHFFLLVQRGEDFGERLIFAAEDLFKVGFESVCLINSDSPTVSASSFAEAAAELSRTGDRVVLGPSDDGGYYLIGLKCMHRRLFQEIDWSTERVLEQTEQRAAEIGVELHKLPSGFDVDNGATLQRLYQELLGHQSIDLAPSTRKFLMDIVGREGRNRLWPL